MFLLSLFAIANCARHAVLFAGSCYWINYRHQADIYAMYTQLLQNGYTEEQITIFAYDDIATDFTNPYPGQIFHTLDHKDNVYPGEDKINYRKLYVSASNLYTCLRTLPTTAEDNVFFFYDNHGTYGTLGVPDFVGGHIDALDLYYAIRDMNHNGMYKYFLFGIEACYSGSVGEALESLPNLITITAANDHESSYATGYDSVLGTYITNVFANNWMAYVDVLPQETLGEFYENLKKSTQEYSEVCWFGDESFKNLKLTEFIGTPNSVPKSNKLNLYPREQAVTQREASERTLRYLSTQHKNPSVRAKARLTILTRQLQTIQLEEKLDKLVKLIDESNYHKIMADKEAKITPEYYEIVDIFFKLFPKINPDDYGRFSVLKALAAYYPKSAIIKALYTI